MVGFLLDDDKPVPNGDICKYQPTRNVGWTSRYVYDMMMYVSHIQTIFANFIFEKKHLNTTVVLQGRHSFLQLVCCRRGTVLLPWAWMLKSFLIRWPEVWVKRKTQRATHQNGQTVLSCTVGCYGCYMIWYRYVFRCEAPRGSPRCRMYIHTVPVKLTHACMYVHWLRGELQPLYKWGKGNWGQLDYLVASNLLGKS